jgi:hypothetical protein
MSKCIFVEQMSDIKEIVEIVLDILQSVDIYLLPTICLALF